MLLAYTLELDMYYTATIHALVTTPRSHAVSPIDISSQPRVQTRDHGPRVTRAPACPLFPSTRALSTRSP